MPTHFKSGKRLDSFQNRVSQTIRAYRMCRPGDRILIGVSGGADSLALMYVLFDIAEALAIELGVSYLNHGLRPQAAEKEAAFVQEKADVLGLPCYQGKVVIEQGAGSVEERARIKRYAFLKKTAADYGYNKIAVGHHMEDNAESMLMHLLRGSGIRGLSGIAPVRDDGIIRPLINCRKADILAYLTAEGHTHMVDDSNDDLRFERNRIRHDLIPHLERNYHSKIVETLNRTAALCREEEQWLQNRTANLISDIQETSGPEKIVLSLEKLRGCERPMQRRVIRDALRQWHGHLKRLTASHVESIIELSLEDTGNSKMNLPNRLTAKKVGGRLTFEKTGHPRKSIMTCRKLPYCHTFATLEDLPLQFAVIEAGRTFRFSILHRGPNERVACLDNNARDNNRVFFDIDKLTFPLSIRNRKAGDRIHPFGMQGTQKLKQLLGDRKIPVMERDKLPLLVSGDEIIWVAGIRRANTAPVTEHTAQTLFVSVEFMSESKK